MRPTEAPCSSFWLVNCISIYRRFVAMKVSLGRDDTNPSTEAQILQNIQETKGRGQEHIIKLHEFFTIRGPNGYHECLVTEVVIPLSTFDIETRKKLSPQSLNKQIALEFDYLHSQGVSHGGTYVQLTGVCLVCDIWITILTLCRPTLRKHRYCCTSNRQV